MRQYIVATSVVALATASAWAETDASKAEKALAKGGAHWSAPQRIDAAGAEILPGNRLMFWPVDDEVHEVVNNHVALNFHWALKPGQKTFDKRQALSLAVHSSADPSFKSSTIVQPAAGEESGVFEAELPVGKLDANGEAELLLYLKLAEPQSNLLQIKVRFGRQARVPRIIR